MLDGLSVQFICWRSEWARQSYTLILLFTSSYDRLPHACLFILLTTLHQFLITFEFRHYGMRQNMLLSLRCWIVFDGSTLAIHLQSCNVKMMMFSMFSLQVEAFSCHFLPVHVTFQIWIILTLLKGWNCFFLLLSHILLFVLFFHLGKRCGFFVLIHSCVRSFKSNPMIFFWILWIYRGWPC